MLRERESAMIGSYGANIVIVIHAGCTVEAYVERYAEVAVLRPERCPCCGAVGQMIGHGWYPRQKPLQATTGPPRPIKIRRWKCKACKHTTSMLPDVLHRYRHYVLAVIALALVGRYVLGQTWTAIQAGLSGGTDLAMPSLDSLMRWGKAFDGNALRWLNGMLKVLAVVMPHLSVLDAHGHISAAQSPTQQVLYLAPLLVHWLANANTPLPWTPATEVSTDEIGQTWGWGWNASLGRLV